MTVCCVADILAAQHMCCKKRPGRAIRERERRRLETFAREEWARD